MEVGTVVSQTLIGQNEISAAGNSIRMTNCGCLCHRSDSSHPAMSESLQQLILDYLNTHGSLPDTRTLSIRRSTAQATDPDAQSTILGALNSLLSREVSDQLSPSP